MTQRLGCTAAQALYRIAQTRGVTPISGTKNEEHMKQDVEAEQLVFDEGTAAEVASLTSGFMGID